MNEEKKCESCKYYCHGNGQCVVRVWDGGKQYQMDAEKSCALYEKSNS